MLELTKSNEDYLEAIGLLSEKNGTAQVRGHSPDWEAGQT